MEELVGKIFKMLKGYLAGFIVTQCCTIEHTGVRTRTGSGGLIEDWKGLVGVQV